MDVRGYVKRQHRDCIALAILAGTLVGLLYVCVHHGWAVAGAFIFVAASVVTVTTAAKTARLCVLSIALRGMGG
jgi:hypothetical protein